MHMGFEGTDTHVATDDLRILSVDNDAVRTVAERGSARLCVDSALYIVQVPYGTPPLTRISL
jgi:hypothetical protein